MYGFTWPKYAGGPMYYASKIGLKRVYERICYYHKQHRKCTVFSLSIGTPYHVLKFEEKNKYFTTC